MMQTDVIRDVFRHHDPEMQEPLTPLTFAPGDAQHHLPVPFAGEHGVDGVDGAVCHVERGVLVDRGLAVLHTVMLSVCSLNWRLQVPRIW